MATTFLDVLFVFEPVARTDRHRLAGVVTVDGLPAEKRIHVHLRSSMVQVAATYSDPVTGEWEIFGLPEYPEGSLIVIASDNTGTYNAEVADYVSQGQGIFFI
jgi:hypothetical protein